MGENNCFKDYLSKVLWNPLTNKVQHLLLESADQYGSKVIYRGEN